MAVSRSCAVASPRPGTETVCADRAEADVHPLALEISTRLVEEAALA
jgi:hypothetical protein